MARAEQGSGGENAWLVYFLLHRSSEFQWHKLLDLACNLAIFNNIPSMVPDVSSM
jgi:hypothetical protein